MGKCGRGSDGGTRQAARAHGHGEGMGVMQVGARTCAQ